MGLLTVKYVKTVMAKDTSWAIMNIMKIFRNMKIRIRADTKMQINKKSTHNLLGNNTWGMIGSS